MTNLKDNELIEMIDGKEKALIYFSAEWCGPCKILRPTMDKIESEYKGDLKFAKADVGEAEKATARFGIKNIPTCVLTSEGKEIARFSGVKTEDQIKKFLQDNQN